MTPMSMCYYTIDLIIIVMKMELDGTKNAHIKKDVYKKVQYIKKDTLIKKDKYL